MKRIHTITLAAAGVALGLSAQSKFDFQAARLVGDAELSRKEAKAPRLNSAPLKAAGATMPDNDAAYLVLVTINDNATSHDLASLGYDVEDSDSKVLFARLTPAEMEQVAALDFVLNISLGYDAEPLMNNARKATGVDEIHTGSANTGNHSYTGKGVLVSMMDTGLQTNHVNFTKDGVTRFERVWVIEGQYSNIQEKKPSDLATYTHDTAKESHASHVLGIMAGSYKGSPNGGSVALVNERTGKLQVSKTRAISFYGVATDADLAVSIGTLQGNNISAAAGQIQKYSKEVGKPAVLNLSLGNNIGPHDGTDASSKKLAEVGKDVLICLSAGNEGGSTLWTEKTFTASDNSIRTTVSRTGTADGTVDIWGANSDIFTVKLVAVDKTTGAIKYTFTLDRNTGGVYTWIGGPGTNYTNVTKDTEFGKWFGNTGMLQSGSNVNTLNNRYNVTLSLDLKGGSSNNIVPGIIIEGKAGNNVNVYASSGLSLMSNGITGFVNGNPENTINGMACGDNVLVVGSYVNSNAIPTLTSGIVGFGSNVKEGQISGFSSWGKTFNGRQLPDIVGPGQGMISSYNRYYMEAGADAMSTRSAEVGTGSNIDYYAEMSGTSMSSPFVAGVLALWLEADPTLTMDRVKEILKKTADHDEFTAVTPERWGMGKINALAGLKEILGTGAVNTVMADDADKKLIIEPVGGKCYNVFVGGTDGFTANLYNMQGALTATASATGNSTTIDASSLSDGIYLLEVQGKNIHTSRKFVVK